MENSNSNQFSSNVKYGVVEQITPNIRRITAPNPSPFTFTGTGTYIVGQGKVSVIDPGPLIKSHITAILNALAAETITHIVVTHHHSDHSPASRPLAAVCGAPIFGRSVREPVPNDESGDPVEEAHDLEFRPTVQVHHGQLLEGNGWTLECIHTPGHTSNHMCYRLLEEKALFSGDHVMGWSTSVIIPPDGSMSDYLKSLHMLLEADDQIYYPTHGAPVKSPKLLLKQYIDHRKTRERQIIECFENGMSTISEMVPIIYRAIDPRLHGAAARSTLATLIMLYESGIVACSNEPALDSVFEYLG